MYVGPIALIAPLIWYYADKFPKGVSEIFIILSIIMVFFNLVMITNQIFFVERYEPIETKMTEHSAKAQSEQ